MTVKIIDCLNLRIYPYFSLMNVQMKKLSDGPFRNTFYRDVGNGFPVMLVHGFPIDGSLWDYQANKLKSFCRLLIPDLPGSGQSPFLPGITIESMADMLHDILLQEHIDRCILIGHSMGGYITLAFAEKYSQKLKGLGLYHSSAFPDTQEKKRGRIRSIAMMRQYGAGTFLRQMMPNLFGKKYRKNNKVSLQTLIKSKEDADVNALSAYYEAMMKRPARTNILKQLKVPALFVIGKEDTSVPAADVLQQVTLPVVSQVHLLSNTAHLSMLEMPETSTFILEEFIRFCINYPFAEDNVVK